MGEDRKVSLRRSVSLPHSRLPAMSRGRSRDASGTQRVSHIDITMSSAGAVALPRRVAAGSLAPINNLGSLARAAYYVKYVVRGAAFRFRFPQGANPTSATGAVYQPPHTMSSTTAAVGTASHLVAPDCDLREQPT